MVSHKTHNRGFIGSLSSVTTSGHYNDKKKCHSCILRQICEEMRRYEWLMVCDKALNHVLPVRLTQEG